MGFDDVFGLGGFSGADRPNGFIGDNKPFRTEGRGKFRKGLVQLGGKNIIEFAGFPFFECFTDAGDDIESACQSEACFLPDKRIFFFDDMSGPKPPLHLKSWTVKFHR